MNTELSADHKARLAASNKINPEWMTVYEAAVYSTLSVSTLNKMWRQGAIRTKKIGSRRLFNKTQLNEDLTNLPDGYSVLGGVPA